MTKILNERIRGEPEKQIIDDYAKINSNPIFKNLGIAHRDCMNNSMVAGIDNHSKLIREDSNLNHTQIAKYEDDSKCNGITYEYGVPLSNNYPSMNYNRFGYLYNFKNPQIDDLKAQKQAIESTKKIDNEEVQPEVPNIQQIINNP